MSHAGPSIRMSHAGIKSIEMNVGSCVFYLWIVQGC